MESATLLLSAHAEGLGGAWLCAPPFAQQICRSVLGLPREWEAQAMILLGHPEVTLAARARRLLDEVVTYK